jgi:hypothetical protein
VQWAPLHRSTSVTARRAALNRAQTQPGLTRHSVVRLSPIPRPRNQQGRAELTM